jgi:hypothetical protein
MSNTEAIDAARNFLAVAWEGSTPTDADLNAALDRLVYAYHMTHHTEPSDFKGEAPRNAGPELFKQTANRFPNYGLYPCADPTDGTESPMGWGDAIDDLGDITLDMREVAWLADNVGASDAIWSFRLMFFHWGTHARDVSRYLHGRQFG